MGCAKIFKAKMIWTGGSSSILGRFLLSVGGDVVMISVGSR